MENKHRIYAGLHKFPTTHRNVVQKKIPDEIIALIEDNRIAYDILAPYFLKRAKIKKEKSSQWYAEQLKKNQEESRKDFFESLTDEQTEKFLVFRDKYNQLFDEEKYDEAGKLRIRFRSWLASTRRPVGYTKMLYYKHRDSILAKAKEKTKSIQESPLVECSLCGLVLENTKPQRRKHSTFHSKAVAQGRNAIQGRVIWKVPKE